MEKYYVLDTNQHVRVRLTDKGYQRLANLRNLVIRDDVAIKMREYKKYADSDGYTTFILWKFMSIFGAVSGDGPNDYYDTAILINSSDVSVLERTVQGV